MAYDDVAHDEPELARYLVNYEILDRLEMVGWGNLGISCGENIQPGKLLQRCREAAVKGSGYGPECARIVGIFRL